MRLCICGIGGTGGKVASNFLENVDLDSDILSWITEAKYVSPGRVAGIWLEADKKETKERGVFKDPKENLVERGYPGFFVPHDAVPDGCDLYRAISKKYGYDLKKQGFVRDAQYLKAIFEIFETDKDIQDFIDEDIGVNSGPNNHYSKMNNEARIRNPIFDYAWDSIKPYTIHDEGHSGECEGILFIVSFGGGTGTGFINPIIDHIRTSGKTAFPVFVLGILTQPGNEESGQKTLEGQRYLAAISALYDLLTKRKGADGIILMDNEILDKLPGSDTEKKYQNKFIYDAMKPMVIDRNYPGEKPDGQGLQTAFSKGLNWPPIFVPFYKSQPRRPHPEKELVKKALSDGKLFDCTPEKADKAVVFCRGFVNTTEIKKAIWGQIWSDQEYDDNSDKIWVLRKVGERNDEILILLRNPYGNDPKAHEREGTLEKKLCKMIDSALGYMNEHKEDLFYEGKESKKVVKTREDEAVGLTDRSKQALSQFFFGKEGFVKENFGKTEGLAFELREAKKRLMAGDVDPSGEPIFSRPLDIFKKEAIKETEEEKRPQTLSLDEEKIKEIVDKRIDEKLAALKSAK